MMHLHGLPTGTRLIVMCFVLAFLPIVVLAATLVLFIAGMNHLGGGWESRMVELWPRTTPISVHFAIQRMCDIADRPEWSLHEMEEQCRLLEGTGIAVFVRKDGVPVYLSPGAEAKRVEAEATARAEEERSSLVWNNDGFSYLYRSETGAEVYATGDKPLKLPALTEAQREARNQGRWLLYGVFGLAVFVALLLGLLFARMLTRQVLRPLAAMRRSAAAIERGDYDVPAVPAGGLAPSDEVGATCRSFDKMRLGLVAARAERERYEKNRKELLAGISHDLRTPLTALKGYASGILDGVARTEEKRTHYVTQIFRSATILEHLVENLFLFSKLDLGRVDFQVTTVNLRAYLAEYVLERAPWYEDQGLAVRFSDETEDTEPLFVRLDPQEYQRVVENILGNAKKYGGAAPSVDITLSVREDNNVHCTAVVRFADHGPGVPDAELPRLFESFYRTDKARSETQKGSGLGLAIARGVVTGMGGTIHAEATPGGGLTIVTAWPVSDADEAPQA